ncbi:hypothetical protein MC885_003274 [Smutsia gigantea]|nr:hypothetical protein MC885_003274 [Smutsia gigantea]
MFLELPKLDLARLWLSWYQCWKPYMVCSGPQQMGWEF